MLSRQDIPANQMNCLLMLQAVNRAHMDIGEVSERIKAKPSTSFRLLRYLNTPAFPLIVEVHSIPHALSLLGERGARKWVSLIAVTCMASGKSAKRVALPLIRARFCELLAPCAGLAESANDLFLLGLLSAMDGILDMSMPDVPKEIAIREDIRDAQLGKSNKLRGIFDFVHNYERGCRDEISSSAAHLRIREDAIALVYVESVEWVRQMLSGHEEPALTPAQIAGRVLRGRASRRCRRLRHETGRETSGEKSVRPARQLVQKTCRWPAAPPAAPLLPAPSRCCPPPRHPPRAPGAKWIAADRGGRAREFPRVCAAG
jgi:hypothetical protein